MTDGFSCILDFSKIFREKKNQKAPPPPPPLKQSTRNLSLGYTEIEKWRRVLGQDLFGVICHWAV